MDSNAIVALLADADRHVEAFARLDDATHHQSYGSGKWNGLQILAHVADADAAFYYRFLAMAAEEGVTIIPFDEQVWERELRNDIRPVAVSVAMIRAVHAGLTHHLKTLPAATLARGTRHPEHGILTPLRMASVTANHTLHHAGQLDAIREGRAWSKAEALNYWGR
jgi:uncharacterized damage-inducible protein DinB